MWRGDVRVYHCRLSRFLVFVFWSRWAGQDGWMSGWGRSKQRESMSAAKFYLTQQQNKQPHNNTASPLPLPPVTSNPHQNQPPTPPFTRLFQQSDTLNLPSFLHAPVSPCQQLAVRHCHARHTALQRRNDLRLCSLALCILTSPQTKISQCSFHHRYPHHHVSVRQRMFQFCKNSFCHIKCTST